MKIRITDIAKAANVSPATVSNVFNGNNRVSEATRLRVLELARRMGYRDPSRLALKKAIHLVMFKKSGRVVIDSPFFSELITGIESCCRKHQYELSISHVQADDIGMITDLIRDSARPILLLATEMSEQELYPFLKVKAPLVVLDSKFLGLSFHCVHIDNIKAGHLAAEYLIRQGHRELGMIASSFPFNNVRDRQIGFELALRQHGLVLREENLFHVDPTIEGAHEDMHRALKNRTAPMPTGIFAFNDLVAAGSIRALRSAGFQIPADISIIGMDNLPLTEAIDPPLTSVHVPKYSMGHLAVENLLHLAEHSDLPVVKAAVDVRIIERESVVKCKNP